MNLAFSPDVDARFCYALIFVISGLTSWIRVKTLLGNYFLARPDTWLLFLIYLFLPAVLFWMLDRTSVLVDTSLFGALIVAFGFRQILTGENQSLRPAEGFSKLVSPLLAWTETIKGRAQKHQEASDNKHLESVVADASSDQQKFDRLKELAEAWTLDLQSLQTEVQKLQNTPVSGAKATAREIIKTFYDALESSEAPEEFDKHLKEAGFPSRTRPGGTRNRLAPLLAAFLVLVPLGLIAWGLGDQGLVQFYSWRLAKPNASPQDRLRTGKRLLGLLENQDLAPRGFDQVASRFLQPDLNGEGADRVVKLLVRSEAKAQKAGVDLPQVMVPALYADDPDVRSRVNEFLLHLARLRFPEESEQSSLIQGLNGWKPSKGDPVTQIDSQAKKWQQFWSLNPY